jgi:hypothetical protein
MYIDIENPNIRKGRFLWMDPIARRRYIEDLKRRIDSGYFFTDAIAEKVVEELAPVFNDAANSQDV